VSADRTPLQELYSEMLLAHAGAPRNTGPLPDATGSAHAVNPVCGDAVRLWARVNEHGIVEAIRCEATGCALSKASASILTGALRGKSITEARAAIAGALEGILAGSAEALAPYGDAPCLAGVARFPGRVKCVTMAWHAAEEALSPTQ
jgi:nitrogen fixation NifU-like protein